MSMCVAAGATLQCSFGMAPATLMVLPETGVMTGMPTANVMASIPVVNVPPFGMCQSMANPEVIAATAAALGVMTPMPCVPVTPAPWTPGSPTVLIGGMPALQNESKLMCAWGGVIQVLDPGQTVAMVP